MENGRTILLTGVSRGLGHALAEGFIAAGHTVWGCARTAETVADLRSRWRTPHAFETVDVADDRGVEAWARALLANFGPPDIVVNNAGVINANAPLWEVPRAEFDEVVDVNLKGPVNVIRHFAPAMITRGKGVFVNFSSTWGRSVSSEVAPYCATKWAIEGLSQAMSRELPRGMAVVALNPGVIDTDMLRTCFGGAASSYPQPEEWAKAAVPYILGIGPGDSGQPLTVPAGR